jgi:competence protein ComEC
MSDGIDWMNRVALWVTSLPGAVGRMHAFGTGPLLVGTAALLLVCLLRTPLRWSGALLAVGASLWAVTTPQPDILMAGDGQVAAFRGTDGRLAVLHSSRDTFAIKEWLAADADPRTPNDPSMSNGVMCDAIGCIGKLGDGRLVSMVLGVEAFSEDCTRAAVVISPREAPSSACTATIVDRQAWRTHGAVALHWTGDHFEQVFARPSGYERPWTGSPVQALAGVQAAARPSSLDAAPRAEDLDSED